MIRARMARYPYCKSTIKTKMKYTLRVIKMLEEGETDDLLGRMSSLSREGNVIFRGEMNPDETIEILQHLHHLKNNQLEK